MGQVEITEPATHSGCRWYRYFCMLPANSSSTDRNTIFMAWPQPSPRSSCRMLCCRPPAAHLSNVPRSTAQSRAPCRYPPLICEWLRRRAIHSPCREIPFVVRLCKRGRAFGEKVNFLQIEGHEGSSKAHIFYCLDQRAFVTERCLGVRAQAKIRRSDAFHYSRVVDAPRKGDPVRDSEFDGILLHRLKNCTPTHDSSMEIVPSMNHGEDPNSAQQQVNAFLRAHHAYIRK